MIAGIDLASFYWIFPPRNYKVNKNSMSITTNPNTDFWQRTYYGFQHDNAHAYLFKVADEQFSFTVTSSWQPTNLYDQCGLAVYQDADNWFKASVEYENDKISRLGSVVTNLGYSDWATTDIGSDTHKMSYRLSRRGQDFRIENSANGKDFFQMRIFHMHLPIQEVNIGVYACSPLDSSFEAKFTNFRLEECKWELTEN